MKRDVLLLVGAGQIGMGIARRSSVFALIVEAQ